MKLGISTSCYYPLETELSLEEVGKTGAKHAEIFFNANCELKDSFVCILTDIQKKYGLKVDSVHAGNSASESYMIFSNYDRRFYESLDNFARYSEVAANLGAKYIIFHGGKPNGILEDEEYCERYMALKNVTLKNGVTLLQENVVNFRAGNVEFLRSMKEILGDDAEFCFDIKQCVRSGYSPIELIDEFSDNIRHYHISDHSLASDCLLPFDGGFDFENLLKILKAKCYDRSLIIDVYNNAYKNYLQIANSYHTPLKMV